MLPSIEKWIFTYPPERKKNRMEMEENRMAEEIQQRSFGNYRRLLSAQWRLVASTPFALRPGLSRERVVRTKGITEERTKGEERACRTKERTKERTPPTPSLRTP